MLSETDLALINALQVAPRADWMHVGKALGISAATAARRWEALRADRVAWVASAVGPRFRGAAMFLYLAAAPGQHEALSARLCDEPAAATVSVVTGPFTFLVDCLASDQEQLNDLAINTFATMPEVARLESTLWVQTHRTGSDYRSGVLDLTQARAVTDGGSAAPRTGVRTDQTDRVLVRELSRDGRASWAELAERCGVSPQTARRRVEGLIACGHVTLRCECSIAARGPYFEVNLQIDVPEAAFGATTDYFAQLKECRLSAQVVGSHNLTVTLWLRDLREIRRHERELGALAPGMRVLGRDVSVRTIKRLGHVLDEKGRTVRVVPPFM